MGYEVPTAVKKRITAQDTLKKIAEQRATRPELFALEREARTQFETTMRQRGRFEFESVEWWRCHERAQAWHEIAVMICEARKS